MKLVIINQHASTGGWRYLYMLVKNIKKIRKDFDITIISSLVQYQEDVEVFKDLDVKVKNFPELTAKNVNPADGFKEKKLFHIRYFDKMYNKIRRHFYKKRRKKIKKESIEQYLQQFDCIFYNWPYDINFIKTNKPVFFIPHDFIFTHFFGFHSGNAYNRNWWIRQKKQIQQFVDYGAKPIVSSQYIADEYNRVFPTSEKKPSVVYLSTFNEYEQLSKEEINSVLNKYGISNDYILYANNWALHKNMQPVLGAYYQVKQKYPNIKLIVTGYGTKDMRCVCNTPYYFDHVEDNEEFDSIGLGQLPDKEFSAILQGAKMVINSSLCEAGSGSGVDAWNCKIPLVFSSIPPFLQQLEVLGTKAKTFDPRNSDSIAQAILSVLDNPEEAKKDAEISYEALSKYTWEDVARQYIEIFENNMPSKEYQELTKKYPAASPDDLVCYAEMIKRGKND